MQMQQGSTHSLLLCLVAVALLEFFANGFVRAESASSFPAPELLQAGDLIWPKKPGAIVPYNSEPGEADKTDAVQWKRQKEAYLKQLEKKTDPTPEEKVRYTELQSMTYKQFVARYLDNRSPSETTTYGTGNVSVGHVGIIQIIDGKRDVVEAMLKPGVRRISYAAWIAERPGELIWVGRLKGCSAEQRAAVAKTAASYIGRPYNFWNFDLSDTTGFYCSKLAWLSILVGAGFPPDDKQEPNRILWYSPKQLMQSAHVELIVDPGSYQSKHAD